MIQITGSNETVTQNATLTRDHYTSPVVFELERERIFFRQWMCLARDEEVPAPGDVLERSFAGESFLLTRDLDGELHAFYNVCRHRGTKLFDGPGHVRKVITCPYHAWSYALDGRLVGTPNVRVDEGFDRETHPLWDVHVATWEGFVFVNASDDPPPLIDVLRDDPEEPMQFARYGMEKLRIGSAATYDVAANWKITIDNYNECLHCPSVHPELVSLVPVYRRGTTEEDPGSWGVTLREGATSLTRSGLSSLPPLPGIEAEDRFRYYGCHIFPNLFIDFTSDNVTYDILLPDGPARTLDVGGYLLHPDTLATNPDLDDIIEFGDLVTRQDIAVCEREQMGVGSRAFARGGTLVPKDELLGWFRDRYLEIMEP